MKKKKQGYMIKKWKENKQLFTEVEVNSGWYLPSREAAW